MTEAELVERLHEAASILDGEGWNEIAGDLRQAADVIERRQEALSIADKIAARLLQQRRDHGYVIGGTTELDGLLESFFRFAASPSLSEGAG